MEAVIQPFKLSEVQQSLMDASVGGITVTEVKGHGSHEEAGLYYRGTVDKSWPAAKILIEVVVGDRDLREVVEALCRAARTGRSGDGMIFISDVDEAIRIRNDQRNEAAV
ncbi:P-II family nitrogen regulator [uncultured Paludibaculum sp.]|uniref:P-II family nitrogen regulator n=1 Tax=uncultured Paludibaculum sp. TaxID=1765020 RepID=UPI002AAB678C|nr:P-II family nitrogen regulator [uncultured Paludibaculum sp.]